MIQFRIANALGLDTKNAQHSVAIDEALIGIDNTNAFYEFCVDKKDGITYATKPERLMALSIRYKKLQENAKLPHDTAVAFSGQLAHKVEMVRVMVKNEIEVGRGGVFKAIKTDGHTYFSKQELSALKELGSEGYVIELCEQSKLEEEIIRLFLSKYIKKSQYASLTEGQKKMQKLLQN